MILIMQVMRLAVAHSFVGNFGGRLFRQIETSADTATLQNDLDHLTDWSIKWQMNFNVNKCKRFHIGQTNPHNKYTIAGIDLVECSRT